MNYALKNESKVSDAYTQSVEKTQGVGPFSSIGATNPVQYPNAREVDPAVAVEKSQSANQKFNQVAASFSGLTTGYGSDSSAYGYSMVGSTLDLYA
jgi:hypothetical protein